jgi:hypothetical protein
LNREEKTAIYAPDTNFFIQCKDAAELDWSLVSDAENILIVVLDEVHREIDRLKSDGNTRRARRARAISSKLRSLIVDNQEELALRMSSPAVSLRLAPRLDPKKVKPNNYDSTSADERIATEAKVCSEDFFNEKLTILSHDGMPLRSAKMMGLQACPIPDAWLLPPEPSDKDQAIQKLIARVAALEKQAPIIMLRLEGDAATNLTGKMTFYPPLTDSFINGVMLVVRRMSSVQQPGAGKATSAFENIIRGLESAPTNAETMEYEERFGKWIQKVEELISRLPSIHNLATDGIEGHIVLSNSGSMPAEHLVIDVLAEGAICLQKAMDEDDKIRIPTIPEPPKPRRYMLLEGLPDYAGGHRILDPLANFRISTPRPARNPHKFYWNFDEPKVASKRCRGECADFRHGLNDERIRLLLRWDEPKAGAIAGAVRIVVSARNLPSPVEKTIPVRLDVAVGDSEELVRSIILKDLGISI